MAIKCIVSQDEDKPDGQPWGRAFFSKDCRVLTVENKDMGAAYNEAVKKYSLDAVDGWIVFCKADLGFCENIDLKMNKLKTDCVYGPSGFKVKSSKFRRGIKRVGRFFQADDKKVFNRVGKTVIFPTKVMYLDYNCIIIHSSMIKKYDLVFPEGLDDDEMVRTFCCKLRNCGINLKAIPISCYKVNP